MSNVTLQHLISLLVPNTTPRFVGTVLVHASHNSSMNLSKLLHTMIRCSVVNGDGSSVDPVYSLCVKPNTIRVLSNKQVHVSFQYRIKIYDNR